LFSSWGYKFLWNLTKGGTTKKWTSKQGKIVQSTPANTETPQETPEGAEKPHEEKKPDEGHKDADP
jgi:hypothetical protein